MNKFKVFYIIILFLGLSLSLPAAAVTIGKASQTYSDAIDVDSEPIEKREFGNLNDTYTGEDFIYERTIETSGWWTRFRHWLADVVNDLFDFNSSAKSSKFVTVIIYIFVIIVVLMAVFFIFKSIINKEGKWIFGKSSDKGIIPVTDIESNIHQADFKSLISAAEKENNFRLAVRYYYLWLLKRLSHAEIIDYDVEKTNSDYYYEIIAKETKEEFSYTSYLYNYIWYGEFDIDQHQFDKAKSAFTQFLNSIKG